MPRTISPTLTRALGAVVVPTALLFACAQGGSAQGGEAAVETLEQRTSYTIGYNLGRNLQGDEVAVDVDLIVRGLRDALGEAEPQLSEEQMQQTMLEFQQQLAADQQQRQAEVGQRNREEGAAFLAENATKDGVQTTPSGLQYEVLEQGTGPRPATDDVVRVHYRGTTLDGETFDASYDRGQPAVFSLERVIAGWTEGLQLMPVGSKYKFYVPSALAYGPKAPHNATFGPDAVLVFEIELLGIEKQ